MKNLEKLVGLGGRKSKGYDETPSPKRCLETELIEHKKYVDNKKLLAGA